MHYEQETGNCDSVNYQRYCDDIEERDNKIENLEHEKIDLLEKIQQYKDILEVIERLAKKGIVQDAK